jgi:hypothetical protein
MRGLIDLLYNHLMEDLTREQKIEAAHQRALGIKKSVCRNWLSRSKRKKLGEYLDRRSFHNAAMGVKATRDRFI